MNKEQKEMIERSVLIKRTNDFINTNFPDASYEDRLSLIRNVLKIAESTGQLVEKPVWYNGNEDE